MSVNNTNLALSFNQAATLLNSVVKQATGQDVAAQIAAGDFVSIQVTTSRVGMDTLGTAISQVLGRTIFSIRPYSGRLAALGVTEEQFGSITRKINYVDAPLVDDKRLTLTDGASIDAWEVRKPKAIETKTYGGNTYSDFISIYSDQLNMAFQSVNEFNIFITGLLQNLMDRIELAREGERRTCLLNAIGGVMTGNSGVKSKINLLKAYNDQTGAGVTTVTVFDPDNFGDFVKWASAHMAYVLDLMSERNVLFHRALTAGTIMRHTPASMRKAVFKSDFVGQVNARIKGDMYNPEYLNIPTHSEVAYWQDALAPERIMVSAGILKADGSFGTAAYDTNTKSEIILGIVWDEEAMGQANMANTTWTSPYNGRGGYYNQGYNFRVKTWTDFTENMVVFYLADEE